MICSHGRRARRAIAHRPGPRHCNPCHGRARRCPRRALPVLGLRYAGAPVDETGLGICINPLISWMSTLWYVFLQPEATPPPLGLQRIFLQPCKIRCSCSTLEAENGDRHLAKDQINVKGCDRSEQVPVFRPLAPQKP